jgi:SAM-dependent methyltransferase
MRRIVWKHLEGAFPLGARIWELNCGTGEDALWLADRGVQVWATDGSRAMLELAARKVAASHRPGMISLQHFDFSCPTSALPGVEFDGALSNFGGMNCVRDLNPLARTLGRSIRPGGRLIVVVMGRWCAWEMLWHLAHAQPRRAFRRLARHGAEASLGDRKVRIWYPSAGSLRSAFSPEFRLRRRIGVGVFLPPSYLQAGVARREWLIRLLRRLDASLAPKAILNRLGDHILYDFERTVHGSRDSG